MGQVIANGDFVYVATNVRPFILKISIYDGTILMRYTGHMNTVSSLFLYGAFLFSGSLDYSVECWEEQSGLLVRSFLSHSFKVKVIAVYDGVLYSAGDDFFVLKWIINSGEIIEKFPVLHREPVSCLAYLPQKLFTASTDGTIVKRDSVSGELLFEYKGTTKNLRAAAIWKNFIFIGGDSSQIQIWDSSLDSMDVYSALSTNSRRIFCIFIFDNFLYSGGDDKFVRKFDIATSTLKRTFESSLALKNR